MKKKAFNPNKYPAKDVLKVLNHKCFEAIGYFDGTVSEFMSECLKTFWEEAEGFSGKRPICDSGWEHIAAEALVILEPKIGKFDDGDFEVTNEKLYQETFQWLVDYIFHSAFINLK